MGDPLSVVSGAAGIASLGVTVCNGLVTYVERFNAFESETTTFITRVTRLKHIFDYLNNVLRDFETSANPPPAGDIQQITDCILDCSGELDKLKEVLEKCRGCDTSTPLRKDGKLIARKALYPFRRGTMMDLEKSLSSLQSNLDTALQVFQLSSERRTQDRLELTLSTSQSVVTNTTDLRGRLNDITLGQQKAQNRLELILSASQSVVANTADLPDRLNAFSSGHQRFRDQLGLTLSASKSVATNTAGLPDRLDEIALGQQNQIKLLEEQRKMVQDAMSMFQQEMFMMQRNASTYLAIPGPTAPPAWRDQQLNIDITPNQAEGFADLAPRHRRKRCTCFPTNGTARQRWSFLPAGFHLKSCPVHPTQERITMWSKRLVFCNRYLGAAVILNLAMGRRADGLFGISPGLAFQSVVSWDSPAYKLLERFRDGTYEMGKDRIIGSLRNSLNELRIIFADGRASPGDILPDGRSLLAVIIGLLNLSYDLPQDDSVEYVIVIRQFIDFYNFPLSAQGPMGNVLDYLVSPKHRLEVPSERWSMEYSMVTRDLISKGAVSSRKLPNNNSWTAGRAILPMLAFGLPMLLRQGYYAEEVGVTDLRAAIIARSESDLTRALADDVAEIMEEYDFRLAASWPQGLELLLEKKYCPNPWEVLFIAIAEGSVKCVTIALTLPCYLAYDGLEMAADPGCYDKEVFQLLVSTLVERRNELQNLAEKHLPSSMLAELGLTKENILDYQAVQVYRELRGRGVSVRPELRVPNLGGRNRLPLGSVFEVVEGNVEAAEILYSAGFSIFACKDGRGLPALFDIGHWLHSAGQYFGKCQWVISKLSRHPLERPIADFLPLYEMAGRVGDYFESCHLECGITPCKYCAKSQWSRVRGERHRKEARKYVDIFKMLLLDETHRDTCKCACAVGGCLPSTIMLKEYLRKLNKQDTLIHLALEERSPNHLMARLMHWLDTLLDPAQVQSYHDNIVSGIIRLCVFAELDLSHTCCTLAVWPKKQVATFSAEDAQAIQEDEIELIDKLEFIVRELVLKYNQIGIPLPDFLDGCYVTTIDELWPKPETVDPDELLRIRELGVVIE